MLRIMNYFYGVLGSLGKTVIAQLGQFDLKHFKIKL